MSGSRGPLTVATSTRGARAAKKQEKQGDIIITAPAKPEWLPIAATELWESIIADLEAAHVPLARVDGSAIGLFVLAIHRAAEALKAGDVKLSARINRDAIAWATAIGATPAARARLGIKPEHAPKPSKWSGV